jgi:L-ascorbate metabolism protein UlaG (beta-lactamase superfamily)
LRDRVWHLRRHGARPPPESTERIDAVLVSHLHLDHLDAASMRRLRRDVCVIAPAGAGAMMRRLGFARTTELRAGERAEVGGAAVLAVPAVHDGRRHPLAPRADAIGFVVDGGHRVYFAGDTDVFDGMSSLDGRVDVALLPIWGWGRRLPPGHLSPASAARAVALVRPAVAIPIHWGTLRSIGAPHDTASSAPARAFAAEVEAQGLPTTVRILVPGESASFGVESGRPN